MQTIAEQDRQDAVVIRVLARLPEKVNYQPVLARLRQRPQFYLGELDSFFTKKQVPLLLRDLETLRVLILNKRKEIPEGIVHFDARLLSDLLCFWLGELLEERSSWDIARRPTTTATRRAVARALRLRFYQQVRQEIHASLIFFWHTRSNHDA